MSRRIRRGSDSREDKIDRLIAEFLNSCDAGHEPDREQLLAANPGERAELEQFFADHDFMRGTSADMR